LLARRALETGDGKAPRQQIAVTVCGECKRGWQDGAGAVVELDAATLERVECDADRLDSRGRITRHIPEPTRRMVLRRDHNRCRVPGCRSSRNLDMHHIVEFAHAGNHEATNLVTICSGHHRAIHEGRLTLTMENGEPKFERIAPMPSAANDTQASITETAQRALIGLGFKKTEARSFVELAIARVGKTATVQVLVHEALKCSPMPG
jgi:5-methylcytosine-specific restriction endonuclease McrA